jgi:hypothetical protein
MEKSGVGGYEYIVEESMVDTICVGGARKKNKT